MKIDKTEEKTITKVIEFWVKSAQISPEKAAELRNSYEVRDSNIDSIALYALISAISCGLLSFGALVLDEKWIELLRKEWGFSESIVGLLFAFFTILLVYIAARRQQKNPDDEASNESYNITIILTTAISVTYLVRSFPQINYAFPLLICAFTFGGLGSFLHSKLLWAAMLACVAGWWGAQTYYWSGEGFKFAGANYPLRMTIFSLVIWGLAYPVSKIPAISGFHKLTYTVGLFMFLTASWTLSIFGNYDDLERWTLIKQGHFWYWALGFSLMLIGLIAYAFRTGNTILRDICLSFFLLNIYTRYFEYFWDRTNKGIFFAFLAISFWLVGKQAEKWRNKEQQKLQNDLTL